MLISNMRPRDAAVKVVTSVSCLHFSSRSAPAHTNEHLFARRASRKRNAAVNTKGRSHHMVDLIKIMKSKSALEAKKFFSSLHPRDQLDVMRALSLRRQQRKHLQSSNSSLPKYRSIAFARSYFFNEKDLTEESTLGRGPGGQATNRRKQTVILTHRPSGIIVKYSRFPSLHLNRRAAREILNLRLEEHLAGPVSQLGRAKILKEKRRLRRARVMEHLSMRGSVLAARATQRNNYYAFLTGKEPLPYSAAHQLGERFTRRATYITHFFEEECMHWWPLLTTAFGNANKNNSVTASSTEVSASNLELPQVLQLMLPAPAATFDTSVERWEREELDRCRRDAVLCQNVRRVFLCFAELFGLRLVQVQQRSGVERSALVADGMNWVELRSRMFNKNNQVTPFAHVAWVRVYQSLVHLHLLSEARSVEAFFRREARRMARSPDGSVSWAAKVHLALQSLNASQAS